MRPFNHAHSLRLDYVIQRYEAARGWRRQFWQLIKRYLERGL